MPSLAALVFIAAAVLFPLAAWTEDWPLVLISTLILLGGYIVIIRERLTTRSLRRGGRQVPLDPDPFDATTDNPKEN